MDEPLHFSHVRTPSTLRAHNNLSTALKDTGQAAACKCTIGSTHVDSLTVLDLEMVEINVSALAMHLSLAIDEEIDLSLQPKQIQSCHAVSRMQLLSGTSCAYGCTHRIRPHMTDGEPGSGWPNMDLSWAIFLPNQTRCYRNFAGVKTCGSLVRTDLCPPPLLLQTSRSWSP
jgi:hypothetical protein